MLATGVIEGTKNAVTDIMPNCMNEALQYTTMDVRAYIWGFMAVSGFFLDSLPDDLRALTVAGIRQMMEGQTQVNKGAEAWQNAVFLEGGGTILVPSEEQMATFRAVRLPMRERYVAEYGEEW